MKWKERKESERMESRTWHRTFKLCVCVYSCAGNWNSNYRHIDFKLELFSRKFKKTWKNALMLLLYKFHLVISFQYACVCVGVWHTVCTPLLSIFCATLSNRTLQSTSPSLARCHLASIIWNVIKLIDLSIAYWHHTHTANTRPNKLRASHLEHTVWKPLCNCDSSRFFVLSLPDLLTLFFF